MSGGNGIYWECEFTLYAQSISYTMSNRELFKDIWNAENGWSYLTLTRLWFNVLSRNVHWEVNY